MATIISAEKIRKDFDLGKGNAQQVLRGVDITVREGEFVAVMGASGSGKSTLLYNVSGMDRPTSGKLVFSGEDLSALSENALSALRLEKMGFVFQQGNLLKNLDIFDNIVLPAYRLKKESRNAINARAEDLMRRMGITEIAGRDISQVSGGQLQRAAICRALINKPRIVFGDEPTGALNSAAALEVMDIFASVNAEGAAVMLVTHDAKVAARAEKALFMRDGLISGSLALGKFSGGETLKAREEKLTAWLASMGF